jgi:hypothetical protein
MHWFDSSTQYFSLRGLDDAKFMSQVSVLLVVAHLRIYGLKGCLRSRYSPADMSSELRRSSRLSLAGRTWLDGLCSWPCVGCSKGGDYLHQISGSHSASREGRRHDPPIWGMRVESCISRREQNRDCPARDGPISPALVCIQARSSPTNKYVR